MSLNEERDKLIKEWLEIAAEEIAIAFEQGLEVETKANRTDLVTQMDRGIEKDFVERIRAHYPNDLIVSEEGYGDEIEKVTLAGNTVWFLDPIDGTLNFVLQEDNFVIMLAVYEDGIGQQSYIYDVTAGKLYWAIKDQGVYCNDQLLPKIVDKPLNDGLFASNSMYLSDMHSKLNAEITKYSMGQRILGSAGLESIQISVGKTLAHITYNLKPWDLAPGYMMIQENGGVITRFDGSPVNLLETHPIVMGTPTANKDIVNIIKKFKNENK